MGKIWIAGGCFWGVEVYFNNLIGVDETIVGYAQGNVENPTYELVKKGHTGHTETVEIVYDATVITLKELLLHTFRFIDPTSLNKQGEDIGTQYRAGFYYENDDDLQTITEFISVMQSNYEAPIVVEVEPIKCFYEAEDYHQKYLDKNPDGYCHVDLNLILPTERKN
jgi:methionine-S-sulfoxide reductase